MGVRLDRNMGSPERGEVLAWMILLWAGAALALSALLLWVGQPLSGYALWLGLGIALSVAWKLAPDPRVWGAAALGLAAASAFGALSLEWLVDFSGDGQEYHLPAILALTQGWNPFRVPRLAEWNPGFEAGISSGIFVQHYAKGAWLLAAATGRGSGLLEGSKVWNLLYPLAVLLVAESMLRRRGMARGWSWGLALAVAANPVVLYQLPSFYVDGQLAALYTLALLLAWDYLERPAPRTLALLAVSLVLLANLKFTGLVYAVALVFALAALAWLWGARDGLRAYLLTASLALLVAGAGVGYQPYVTNTLQQGHPFYPAVGREDGRNIQWRSAPSDFLAMNRVEKLVRSLGGRSSGSAAMPDWKPPFAVDKQELFAFLGTDTRYGGFGPWFGGALLLTLIILPFALHGRGARLVAGIAAVVAMTALLNPEAWWARLSPQLWLLPPLLIGMAALGQARWLRLAAAAVLLALLGNAFLVGAVNWGRAIEKNLAFRSQLAQWHATPEAPAQVDIPLRFRMATEARLHHLGMAYRLTDAPACPRPQAFSYPEAAASRACLPARE